MRVLSQNITDQDPTTMMTQAASRRLNVIGKILSSSNPNLKRTSGALETIRLSSHKSQITIGDVSKTIEAPKHPEYVPVKYLRAQQSQQTLKHLRWMLQKDLLGQDMFLMGRPGPARRRLALQFLELTQRELEFVSLSRDTTEADLKQRREIKGGSARYFDQSAVRAATEGRVLVLEGVEKAERNVLPVLNNLLENREMHLEDGRFLIPANRYDKLLKDHSQEDLNRWRLVRVSEDFRVIALGLPVPKYPGNPLDPPLRSRFQARFIETDTFKDLSESLARVAPGADPGQVGQLLSCCFALLSPEAADLNIPDFPASNLPAIVRLMEDFPNEPLHSLLTRAYPFRSLLGADGVRSVEELLATFNVTESERPSSPCHRVDSVSKSDAGGGLASVTISRDGVVNQVEVPCGAGAGGSPAPTFVETGYQESVLAQLMQSHRVGDACIIGPRGCGKTACVRQLAALLNYTIEPIVLYQDMTSRDLVQQRSTLPNGDTVWHDSPLVSAAISGHLAVLDGLHRVHPGTLAVVHRLAQDRELQLHDGRRLLRHDRFDELKSNLKWSNEQMEAAGIQKIHPSFRMIALAEPPSSGKGATHWLTPEMLNLFLFHEMRPLSSSEELALVTELFGEPSPSFKHVLDIAHGLREAEDPTLRAIASSLSTRQLIRISKRMACFPSDDARDAIQRASLARFLPHIARQALDKVLNKYSQSLSASDMNDEQKLISINGDDVYIGKTYVKRYPDTEAKSKVPDILFYDVPQHVALLEILAQDFLLGEHLLLVGNQGVGKNKVADRLLQLLNRPREYIQLHRDTTVQTLTLQPTVRDGIVVYEDSPLVTAVKLGHVLVVDEADKAPTHVTCILKTLVESGEMILSDGRRIVPDNDVRALNPSPSIIPIHPGFRMIVLANRPGFPFLGNDFFGALGDLFSCHAVDNPSPESERALLKSYGPDVPDAIIHKLVKAFGELRSMADQGLVSYPYSTREVVNIVKHLQAYPNEGLTTVVSNVFDFDQHSKEMLDTLINVLQKHGIPIGAVSTNITLAMELPLPPLQQISSWQCLSEATTLAIEERFLKPKKAVNLHHENFILDRVEARSSAFSEMLSYWNIPLSEMSVISGLAASRGMNFGEDIIHVAAMNPLALYSMSPYRDSGTVMSMQGLLSSSRYSRSNVTVVSLKDAFAGSVLVHEESSNSLVLLDTTSKTAQILPMSSLLDQASETLARGFGGGRGSLSWHLVPLQNSNAVIVYEKNGCRAELIDIDQMTAFSLNLPFNTKNLYPAGHNVWLLQDSNGRQWSLRKASVNHPCPSILRLISENDDEIDLGNILGCDSSGLGSTDLSRALGQKISAPNRLLATSKSLAAIVVGFPDLDLSANEVYAWKREYDLTERSTPLVMTDIGQIIRTVRPAQVPAVVKSEIEGNASGYLEVTDILNHKMKFIRVPEPKVNSPSEALMYLSAERPLLLTECSNSGLVTVDASGCLRMWETGTEQLERSLDDWQKLIGKDRADLQLTIESESGKDVSHPKHGKVDPENTPHVGGNTWAGGTGGRDTAGLGGKGGPYRLDAGHTVHQLSDAEKNAIPEHVKKAAREMGQRAFQQRLREIQMSPYDAKLYNQFYQGVSKQIQSLRVVLSSLQAKSKERQWLRHQTSGELDDTKLIEGLTGEKTIYRRRTEADPDPGATQVKPKRLRLVVDVSGSMYRFNGYDGRLDREMEAMVLVMEAFQGFDDKIQYDIHGHSGEGHGIVFVESSKPPKDNKQRLDVIKTMHAHAQFCISGDHTLAATKSAIASLAEEDCDEAIVVVVSDANLERYGISPKRFALALTEETRVSAYAIFIGSLGDQATRLTKQLPAGRAFVCMDLKNLPHVLQQIFTASMLTNA